MMIMGSVRKVKKIELKAISQKEKGRMAVPFF